MTGWHKQILGTFDPDAAISQFIPLAEDSETPQDVWTLGNDRCRVQRCRLLLILCLLLVLLQSLHRVQISSLLHHISYSLCQCIFTKVSISNLLRYIFSIKWSSHHIAIHFHYLSDQEAQWVTGNLESVHTFDACSKWSHKLGSHHWIQTFHNYTRKKTCLSWAAYHFENLSLSIPCILEKIRDTTPAPMSNHCGTTIF